MNTPEGLYNGDEDYLELQRGKRLGKFKEYVRLGVIVA